MAPTSPSPELNAATVVTVEPTEPYPTGAPPDFAAVPLRTHTPQENTEAAHWQAQSEENLAAGGMIAGGLPVEPPVEGDDVSMGNTKRGTGRKG